MVATSRFHQTRELFLEASKLPMEEVSQFLDERCAGDSDLRTEIEELLDFHHTDSGDTPSLQPPEFWQKIPEVIDGYRILRKIGEGGMGEVFEAAQEEPVKRTVALKILRLGLATREVLARFDQERQALALMDHPNISKVYDAGSTPQGRPYFAMEYVEGLPITDHCDNSALGTDERLRLFIQVCHGVQHAHQKAIIHRDLKPSNVLVAVQEEGPLPKIIDFGVAKAISQRLIDETLHTEFGQWLGTPEYMSPEQTDATGKNIDTRTDVFSLGVLLYELLTGMLPFDPKVLREAGFEEIRHLIQTKDPPRPSTRVSSLQSGAEDFADKRGTQVPELVRKLRTDLDAITMKAMSKDRAHRYSSPQELVADIERHLRHEPVHASPASTWYRVERFVRRHRKSVAAAAAILLSLMLAVVGTSIGFFHAKEETRRAQEVSAFLLSMFGELDQYDTNSRATSLLQVLDRGADRILVDLADQPVIRSRLMTEIAVAYRGFFEYGRALELLQQSAAIQLEHLGPNHPDYAETLHYLGTIQADTESFDSARENLDRAVAILEKMSPRDDVALALSLRLLASVHRKTGNPESARATLEQSRRILEESIEGETSELGFVIYTQGMFELTEGNNELARSLVSQGIGILERTLGPDHFEVGWTLLDLARILTEQGEHEEARVIVARGLDLFENTFGSHHPTFAFALEKAAFIDYLSGDLEASQAKFERATIIVESIFGSTDWRLGDSLQSLAAVEALQGQSTAAIEHLKRAMDCGVSISKIFADGDFESLHDHPGFKALVAESEARSQSE